jgi:hypothetical protein
MKVWALARSCVNVSAGVGISGLRGVGWLNAGKGKDRDQLLA